MFDCNTLYTKGIYSFYYSAIQRATVLQLYYVDQPKVGELKNFVVILIFIK